MALLQGKLSGTGTDPAALQGAGKQALEVLRFWQRACPGWVMVAAIAATGGLLRLAPWLAAYPLHRDEALYGAWARAIASGVDPFLLSAWVDKPPLVLYLLAGSLRVFGVSQAALRLPAMLASILTLPAVYGLARRAGGQNTARLATLLVAVSPFSILFAPTAFTDPWLVLWFVTGAWAALARRPVWAGLSLGLAVASKQTGVFAAPLIVALLFAPPAHAGAAPGAETAAPYPRAARGRRVWTGVVRPSLLLLLGFALAAAPVYWWDTLRWATRPSFWQRSLDTYGGLYLAPVATWGERAGDWAGQAGYLFGTPLLTLPVLGLVVLAARSAWRQRIAGDLILAIYSLGYLAVHFFVTFQPWDRYLLPLVPLLAVLAARGYGRAWRRLLRHGRFPGVRNAAAAAALAAILIAAGWLGQGGRVPIGSDHSAFAGLEQVTARLETLPAGAIVYHRSLGWYLDFYLYGRPLERVWCTDAQTLAENAAAAAGQAAGRPQWVVLAMAADGVMAGQVEPALEARGLRLAHPEVIRRTDGSEAFQIYRILPPGNGQ